MSLGIRSLEGCFNGGKERGKERERGEHEIEGIKEGEKWNFEVCLTRLSFIKVTTSVTHASIYRLGSFLGSFLEKTSLRSFFEKSSLRS